MQRSMRGFRRITNRRKRTKWWDANRPTRIYNRHYTAIFNYFPNHYTFYFFFILLQFVYTVYSAVSQLLQYIRLALHPKLVNTITTNLLIRFVKIYLTHSHIPPPDRHDASAMLILPPENKIRHRKSNTRRTLRTHNFSVCQYRQSPLLFYVRCGSKIRFSR